MCILSRTSFSQSNLFVTKVKHIYTKYFHLYSKKVLNDTLHLLVCMCVHTKIYKYKEIKSYCKRRMVKRRLNLDNHYKMTYNKFDLYKGDIFE